MTNLPNELIFVLLFGAALLFNFVKQRAARRLQREAPQDEPAQDEIPEEVWRGEQATTPALPVAAAVAPRQAERPTASPARSRLRVARQSLFGARWDVQEAVVVATILGRCRADEPHDIR